MVRFLFFEIQSASIYKILSRKKNHERLFKLRCIRLFFDSKWICIPTFFDNVVKYFNEHLARCDLGKRFLTQVKLMSGKVLNSVFHFLQVAWRANTNPITCPVSYHGIVDRTRFVSDQEQTRQTFVDFRECPEHASVRC